ncbi:folylpolyglutamate synthase, mitochondrial [Daktulosphaira vitifoliae]|uniref:folylpolyglutamate synthase, mitochondrial n=1 Tax=Daktulosphaira vitifoliae TaxID=58002 RepID=UPI0021AA6BE7|nr:folylpolyglutamate synthase, mitochondrial [Daktulosphaira vitifoliae]
MIKNIHVLNFFSSAFNSIKRNNLTTMNKTTPPSYEATVKVLNSLQSFTGKLSKHPGKSKLQFMKSMLYRCSVSSQELDQLSVIHVAGTKGKGSTCVLCEQLLLKKGYRTGLLTSPHLITVTERFRIDGKYISEDMFVLYFWNIYNSIIQKFKQNNAEEKPSYSMFLTIMAIKIFLNEKVDVAIIETGVGGEYDYTNILRKVPVVGISSLGFDHTNVLGNTLSDIAWQKCGIMKPHSVTIIANNQPYETYKTIINRSIEKQTILFESPPFNTYECYKNIKQFGKYSPIQEINASLAIQLVNFWINRHKFNELTNKCKIGSQGIKQAPVWKLTSNDLHVFENFKWPGRNQVLCKAPNLTYYLDGAHTVESIELCKKWFTQLIDPSSKKTKNILIFNVTGKRDYETFLKILLSENRIDLVILCPIVTYLNENRPDTIDVNCDYKEELERCQQIKGTVKCCNVEVLGSIQQTINFVSQLSSSNNDLQFQILVTGSLKLVGGVLDVLK